MPTDTPETLTPGEEMLVGALQVAPESRLELTCARISVPSERAQATVWRVPSEETASLSQSTFLPAWDAVRLTGLPHVCPKSVETET